MSKISNEQIADMIAGLKGVTPGPWDESAGLVRAIDGDVAIPIFETREPWKKHRRISTVVKQEWHNRHHIARCDPDTMRSILSELQSLRSQAGVSEPFAYTTQISLDLIKARTGQSGSFALFLPFEGMDEIKGVEFVPLYARPAPIEITEEMVERAARAILYDRFGSDADAFFEPVPDAFPDAADARRLFARRIAEANSEARAALTAALQGETK